MALYIYMIRYYFYLETRTGDVCSTGSHLSTQMLCNFAQHWTMSDALCKRQLLGHQKIPPLQTSWPKALSIIILYDDSTWLKVRIFKYIILFGPGTFIAFFNWNKVNGVKWHPPMELYASSSRKETKWGIDVAKPSFVEFWWRGVCL